VQTPLNKNESYDRIKFGNAGKFVELFTARGGEFQTGSLNLAAYKFIE